MRKDLIIGIAVAAVVHGGFLFGFNRPSVKVQKAVKQDDTIQIEMPTLPPEPPDLQKVEDLPPEDETPPTFAPPSLVDIPSIQQDATFVEEITPPPPPGITQATGIVKIPPTPPNGFGRGLGQIFNISQLDQIPVVRPPQIQPIYPTEMHMQGIPGYAVIAFIVDANGNVRDPYVVDSSRREFEEPALQAIRKWKFRPGRKSGHYVNTRMEQRIDFQLGDN